MLRKIAQFSNNDRVATVYRDSEWSEYRVKITINGEYQAAADCHTDEKIEALSTARYIVGLPVSI